MIDKELNNLLAAINLADYDGNKELVVTVKDLQILRNKIVSDRVKHIQDLAYIKKVENRLLKTEYPIKRLSQYA